MADQDRTSKVHVNQHEEEKDIEKCGLEPISTHSSLESSSTKSEEDIATPHARTTISQDYPTCEKSVPSSNIVDWDGPHDPARPENWPRSRKIPMVICLSFMTFITPLASSMFAPGVLQVLRDFHSTSIIYEAFVISIYILGYAAGPLFLAPLSELYGRLIIYHVCNALFLIFCVACAVSSSLPMLTAFRFLMGFAGSAPITLGGGTIADLFRQEQRGRAIAIWSLGPLMGPVVGPIAGGFLAQAKGWRWIFWVILIVGAVDAILYIPFVHESYPPVLLQRKATQLRKETGNTALRAKGQTDATTRQLLVQASVRPMKLLFLSPIVLLLSLYTAITYGYLYLFFTTLPSVFEGSYHFTAGTVGLTYLGIGVGMLLATVINGTLTDRILQRKARAAAAAEAASTASSSAATAPLTLKPEYRLPLMLPGSVLLPVGLFIYGWTAEYHVAWIVPIIGTAIFGFALLSTMMPVSQYLVDAFTVHAASAIAANAVLRSVVGALLPLAGPAMFSKLGLGWGNSLLGFIALALMGIPIVFIRYGETLRTRKPLKL